MNEYAAVKKIIDEWDPIGLLKTGCPDDEYAPEIFDIVKVLPSVESVDELARVIRQVFKDWFAEYLAYEDCYSIAIEIWKHR